MGHLFFDQPSYSRKNTRRNNQIGYDWLYPSVSFSLIVNFDLHIIHIENEKVSAPIALKELERGEVALFRLEGFQFVECRETSLGDSSLKMFYICKWSKRA